MTDQTAPDHRPHRALYATGPELVVTTDTHRLDLRQVGWIGQTGAFYGLDEDPLGDGYERGSISPLYFPAHADRLDDLEPDGDALCGLCGVPKGSHHHPWTSTAAAIANAPQPTAEGAGA
ncbi:hypothetical protein ACIGD1_11385 [Streptomyces sp. NPDC085612]|uniref:hypothetical protein n=1 Tax=Streptomyces sp. NPDC085612 TaxID=3365732 RepID=UPI0037D10142